jgi:hypothetical protein
VLIKSTFLCTCLPLSAPHVFPLSVPHDATPLDMATIQATTRSRRLTCYVCASSLHLARLGRPSRSRKTRSSRAFRAHAS